MARPRLTSFEKGILVTAGMRALERRGPAARGSGMTKGSLPHPPGLLTEDEVNAALKATLEQRGYTVTVAWGHNRGVDIDARKGAERLLIEAKGDAPTPQMQGNYFLGAIGELVQRMADPKADYGLALPDNPRYRGLVRRLPDLAVDRLRLHVFFVSARRDQWQVAWFAWDSAGPPP